MNELEQLVSLEQAKSLKEMGFDVPVKQAFFCGSQGWVLMTDTKYVDHNGISSDRYLSRPAVSLAIAWMREKFGLHGWIDIYDTCPHLVWEFQFVDIKKDPLLSFESNECYDEYNEAETELLNELIQLAKSK